MKKTEIAIELKTINKTYKNGSIRVLCDVNKNFYNGLFYAIKGHSGSGKSTLINILGLIDSPDNGEYKVYNQNTKNLSDKELSYLRMKHIGFIFQDYNLNYNLKAYENIISPLIINKDISASERKKLAMTLLKKVGLERRANHFPKELSGGEQQRVAIARSLANNPSIILADEPTGNLDKENEKIIFEKLKELANIGKCVIVVSHSEEIKDYADVILTLENGKLIGEENEINWFN